MSTRVIYVSMIQDYWANSTLDFTQKVLMLQRLCAQPVQATPDDRNPLHIVVAPEYFFRRSPAAAVKKLKDSYFSTDSTGQAQISPATLAHFAGNKARNTMYGRRERELLEFHMITATRGRNVVVVPGTIFWIQRETTSNRAGRMTGKGIVRNTMLVVYRGNVIKCYHKMVESHELDSFETKAYDFHGGHNDGTFEAAGLSLGAEVCADHTGRANLKTTVISRANPHMSPNELFLHNKLTAQNRDGSKANDVGLDVQIVVSDGMPFTNGAIRKGGCAIHCDTRLPLAVKMSHPQTGALTDLAPTSANQWLVRLGPSAAQAQSFQDAKAAMAAKFRPRLV
jgi:hypothetical protein